MFNGKTWYKDELIKYEKTAVIIPNTSNPNSIIRQFIFSLICLIFGRHLPTNPGILSNK